MDFKKLLTRYRQFGGIKLVIEYTKIGALWPGVKAGVKCLVKRKSFKNIYPVVLKLVNPFLVKKYAPLMRSKKEEYGRKDHEHQRNKVIWFCWLQGMEQAPPIVKACYNSLKRNICNREIITIDAQNWREYVELPKYVVEKWEKKQIPPALFSDLLRLELLIKYGGSWIDSTVLCTGVEHTKEYLDADLFFFQYTERGSLPVSISNWFITSCTNNEVLMVLRDMLYAYWKDYDCTLNYYIFHLFFAMLSKEYPEEMTAMPYGQSMNSIALLQNCGEKFELEKWENLTAKVSFHKLAFRMNDKIKNNKENFFNYILSEYGRI